MREETAFAAAGLTWQRDEPAFAKGVLRLKVNAEALVGIQKLIVVYPDNYPYFRVQVFAPGLDLPFHQNPFERNKPIAPHFTELRRRQKLAPHDQS